MTFFSVVSVSLVSLNVQLLFISLKEVVKKICAINHSIVNTQGLGRTLKINLPMSPTSTHKHTRTVSSTSSGMCGFIRTEA